jgi:hypothetical protein
MRYSLRTLVIVMPLITSGLAVALRISKYTGEGIFVVCLIWAAAFIGSAFVPTHPRAAGNDGKMANAPRKPLSLLFWLIAIPIAVSIALPAVLVIAQVLSTVPMDPRQ